MQDETTLTAKQIKDRVLRGAPFFVGKDREQLYKVRSTLSTSPHVAVKYVTFDVNRDFQYHANISYLVSLDSEYMLAYKSIMGKPFEARIPYTEITLQQQ
jgi:hypothetical protein